MLAVAVAGCTTPGPLNTSGNTPDAGLSGDVAGTAEGAARGVVARGVAAAAGVAAGFLGGLGICPAVCCPCCADCGGVGFGGMAGCAATTGGFVCAGSLMGCLGFGGVYAVDLCFLLGGLASALVLGCFRAEVGWTLFAFVNGVPGTTAFSFGLIPEASGVSLGGRDSLR